MMVNLSNLSPLHAGLSKELEDGGILCELVDVPVGRGHVWVGTCARKDVPSAKKPIETKEDRGKPNSFPRMIDDSQSGAKRRTCIQEDLYDMSMAVHDGLHERSRTFLICNRATADPRIAKESKVRGMKSVRYKERTSDLDVDWGVAGSENVLYLCGVTCVCSGPKVRNHAC